MNIHEKVSHPSELSSSLFAPYEELLTDVAGATERIVATYGDDIACRSGCVACCKSFFDIGMVEGFYLLRSMAAMSLPHRESLIRRANKAHRQVATVKAEVDIYARDPDSFFKDLPIERANARGGVPCPLLDQHNACDGYVFRPLVCRYYGYHRPHPFHPDQLDHCFLNFRKLRAQGGQPDWQLAMDVDGWRAALARIEREFVSALFGSAQVLYRTSVAEFVATFSRTLDDWSRVLEPFQDRPRAVTLRFFSKLGNAAEAQQVLADKEAEQKSQRWAQTALQDAAVADDLDMVLNAFFDFMAGQRFDQTSVARCLQERGFEFRRHCLLLALQLIAEEVAEQRAQGA